MLAIDFNSIINDVMRRWTPIETCNQQLCNCVEATVDGALTNAISNRLTVESKIPWVCVALIQLRWVRSQSDGHCLGNARQSN